MTCRPRLAQLAGTLFFALAATFAVGQQQISFSDFSSTAGLVCNGSASLEGCRTSGNVLMLTQAEPGDAGSAWYTGGTGTGGTLPLANGFTTNFQFRFPSASAPPADGIAFVIQKAGSTALADGGGSIGYGDSDNSENPNGFASVAIEFDTYLNSDIGDPYVPHVAVQSCGSSSFNTANHSSCNFGISAAGAVPNLSTGATHTATINYVVPPNCTGNCVPTLTVIIDQTTVLTTHINIPAQLGTDSAGDAFVGFTSATGALYEEHDLLNWNFSITTTQETPVSNDSPVVTATFNNAPDNLVQHTVDFTGAFATPIQGEPTNPVISNSNQAIAPGDWIKYVAGSPFATTTCIPHSGEGGNCKLYTDLCTSTENPNPAGINCPQSTSRNIVIQDSFDANPKPSTAPGTGFGFLMGSDKWTTTGQPSCILEGNLTGTSCPQDILISFEGDASIGTGTTKSLNSTFVSVSNVLMPNTFITPSTMGSNGWTVGATPTLAFASYPPGVDAPAHGTLIPMAGDLPYNGYVAAPIASIAYNLNGAATPPSPLVNSAPCFIPVASAGSAVSLTAPALFAPSPVPVALTPGLNTITYSATDCAGISELVFNYDAPTMYWTTATKTASIYYDGVNPTVSCPAADALWHNSTVTITCTANDATSGLPPITNPTGNPKLGAHSVSIMLTTSVGAGVETTNAVTGSTTVSDVAGNGPVPVGPVGSIKIDTKPPVISPVGSVNVQNFFLNQVINSSYKCSDAGSGVTKCGSTTFSPSVHATNNIASSINTSVLGQGKTFSVMANDLAGNTTTTNLFTYNVSYLFIGFLTLQQPPLMNTFKAGKPMAILFDVQDGKIKAVSGLKLAPTGAVAVNAFSSTNCNGSNPTAVPFSPTLVGLPLGAYSLNWTPPSTLAGKCVTVNVALGDGLTHKVNLKF